MIRVLLVAALIAAVVVILAASAAYEARWNPGDAVALAITAVWLPQTLLLTLLLGRRGERRAVLRDRLDGPGA